MNVIQRTQKSKPPCAFCSATRKLLFLMAGFAGFVLFVFAPEVRANPQLAILFEYLTLINVLCAMGFIIICKLALGAVNQRRLKLYQGKKATNKSRT